MKSTLTRRSPLICQFCSWEYGGLRTIQPPLRRTRLPTHPHRDPTSRSATKLQRRFESSSSIQRVIQNDQTQTLKPLPNSKVVDERLKDAQQLANIILQHPGIPSEADVLGALKAIETISQQIYEARTAQTPSKTEEVTPASALLDLDSPQNSKPLNHPLKKVINALSSLAHDVVCHPSVFITPAVLSTYVDIQAFLSRPSKIPEVFNLFSSKPRPTQGKPTDPIVYKSQNANAIANAIPKDVAFAGLSSAIAAHDLHAALSIIETSVTTTAYRRSKIFRKAVPPALIAGLVPAAAYVLADQMALSQTEMDPEQFQMVAFAGILTYLGTVGTLGFIAMTTANDQMQRVTWVEGTPLRERWIREEERRMIDKIALAWGFKQKSRWGEEEGEEWFMLKDWCGRRGLQVDKVSLMEGME